MDEMDYEIDLMEMLGVLARRGWQIAAFMVISMVVAYFVSSNMTKIYKATSVIMVRNDSAVMSIPFLKDAAGSSSGDMRNYVESLKSRTLAEATLSRLGWLESSGGQEVRAWQNSLSVQQVQGADIARLSVECSNPEKAALFLNTLVEVFQERTQQMNQESARAARDFIQQQLAVAEERLRESESELLRYKETKGIIEPSSETRAWVEKLANIEQLLSQTGVELQAATSEQEKLHEIAGEIDPTLITSTTIVNNPLVQQQKTMLSQLEIDLAAALQQYTENHPTAIGLRAQIEEVSDKLAEEVERIVGSETMSLNPIYQDLTRGLMSSQAAMVGLEAKMAALMNSRNAIEAELASIPEKEVAIARLERNRRVNEEIYVMLRSKYEEMRISEAMKVSGIHVVDEAVVPTAPVKPRKLLNTAIAGILGFFVAVGATFILEQMDTTLKTVQEVEQLVSTPVLGTIPDFNLTQRKRKRSIGKRQDNESSDLIMYYDPRSPISEAFRTLRTNLEFVSPGAPLKSILVSSAGPEEGKSMVAANLAISLAQTGKQVILVDADMRKPTQHKLFSLENRAGLTTLLVRDPEQDVRQETPVPGLSIITGGPIPPNPSELLTSNNMGTVIDSLARNADIVIYDSPPMAVVSDALILSPKLDGVLVVVRLGTTSREAAKRTRGLLKTSRSRVLGIVVNEVAHRHGYGSYYYYHYYGKSEDDNDSDSERIQ